MLRQLERVWSLKGSCIVVTRQITAVTEHVARGSTRDAPCWTTHRPQCRTGMYRIRQASQGEHLRQDCTVVVFYWLAFASSRPMGIFGTHERLAIPTPIFGIFVFLFPWEFPCTSLLHGSGHYSDQYGVSLIASVLLTEHNELWKTGVSSRVEQPAYLQKSHQICTNYRIGLEQSGGGSSCSICSTTNIHHRNGV